MQEEAAEATHPDTTRTATHEESRAALQKLGLWPRAAKALLRVMARRQARWSIDELVQLAQDVLVACVATKSTAALHVTSQYHDMLDKQKVPLDLWMTIPTWQIAASSSLDQNYWSLGVAMLQVLPREVKLPTWLALQACGEPYPSIEQLLYSMDGHLQGTYW